MAVFVALLFLILPISLILYELARRKRCASLPPGPSSLPILGNILEFVSDRRPKHEVIAKLSKQYGDVMTLWFFTKPVIILSSVDAVRQAYIERQHEFSNRPNSLVAVLLFDDNDRDIVFGHYTPKWQAKRKLFHAAIRTLVGTRHLEREMIAVIEKVISKMLQEGEGARIDMQHYIIKSVYNMAMILAFGKRFDLDDPEFLQFVQMHNLDNEAISISRFYDTFPVLQHLPIMALSPSLKKMKAAINVYRGYLMRWFYETREAKAEGEIEYMTQALVKNIDAADAKTIAASEKLNEPPKFYSEDEIMHMLTDVYIASTSTSSSAISWLFLEMVLNPDIQEKCYQEICQVTGGRQVSLSDRQQLPYVEACILETLRHHNPVSLNVPHSPSADTTLRHYPIPAGTETIMNIWALHHDPKLWNDADNFNPTNLLDENGQVSRPPHLFPFGAGRRSCPGEMFAKNNIFLMFTIMLQQLRFERVPDGEYTLKAAEISGEFINVPETFLVAVKEREKN